MLKKIFFLVLILRGGISTAFAQCLEGNCTNGYGRANFVKAGAVYTGTFKDKFPNGEGLAVYTSGVRYEGEWLLGTWHGVGKLTINDGTTIEGAFEYGSLKTHTGGQEMMAEVETATDTETTEEKPAKIATEEVAKVYAVSETSKIWAVSVGVSNYNVPNAPNLQYPLNDAWRIFSFWTSPQGGALDDEHASVLTNDQATKKEVLRVLEEKLAMADENDMVIFFFSGHGLKGAFLTSDYDGNNLLLFHDEVNQLLSRCRAKRKLIIADACHSGSFKQEGDLAVVNGKAVKPNMVENFYDELSKSGKGTAFLLSSSANEESLEVSTLHHSVFTYFVIKGLKGAANTNDDDFITIQELSNYVKTNVTMYAKNLGRVQTPVLKGNFDPNMPVSIVKK